jgi:hypothetical protein
MGSPERVELTDEQKQLDQSILAFIAEFAGQYIKPGGPVEPPTEGQTVEFSTSITEPAIRGNHRIIKRSITITQSSDQTAVYVRDFQVGRLEVWTKDPYYNDPLKPWRPKITYQNDDANFPLEGAAALARAKQVLGIGAK